MKKLIELNTKMAKMIASRKMLEETISHFGVHASKEMIQAGIKLTESLLWVKHGIEVLRREINGLYQSVDA